jgi:hypothetical protein
VVLADAGVMDPDCGEEPSIIWLWAAIPCRSPANSGTNVSETIPLSNGLSSKGIGSGNKAEQTRDRF